MKPTENIFFSSCNISHFTCLRVVANDDIELVKAFKRVVNLWEYVQVQFSFVGRVSIVQECQSILLNTFFKFNLRVFLG